MSYKISQASDQIQQEVVNTEASIDQALASLSVLMTAMVNARIDTGVPAATGQLAIRRLAKAQTALVETSNEILRVHSELLKVGTEHAILDTHECPPAEGSNKTNKPLSIVA